MNFAGKWIQLETLILSEITQTKKALHVFMHLQININYKIMDIHTTLHKPKDAKQEGRSKCAWLSHKQKGK